MGNVRAGMVTLAVALAVGLGAVAAGGEASTATAPGTAAPGTVAAPGTAAEPSTATDAEDAQSRSAAQGFIDKLATGGRTMIALLALSVMGGAFALERLFRLRRRAIVPSGLGEEADELWQAGDFREALAVCRQRPSTLGRAIEFIIRHRGNPVADIAKGAEDQAATELRRHLQRTYPLAVVGTLAPLLGLLGTVIGMIDAFDIVAIHGKLGDPTLLAGGISKALITTATGLVIAVPALAVYHYFRSRTTLFGLELEEQVNELMSRWLMKREADDAD